VEAKEINENTKIKKKDGEKNLYAQIANHIKQWNRLRKAEGVILGTMGLCGCAALVLLEICLPGWGSFFGIGAAICFGFMVAWMHCELYVRVDGKGNRLNQYIHDIPLFMAFSIKDYYKEIERRLWKKMGMISGIVFAILFVFSILPLFDQFFLVLEFCTVTVVALDISIVVSYFLLRYFDMRSFATCMEKGKTKKHLPQSKVSFYSEHPVFLFLMCIVSIFGFGILGIGRNYLVRVPEDVEVYRTVTDWFLPMYISAMCVIYGGQEIGKLATKQRGSIKNVIAYCVVLVISLLYGCTIYNTYYEDKIVVNRVFVEKEYAWDDVQSYTVKPKWLSGILQLELEMEDRTLWVISGENIRSEKCDDKFDFGGGDYEYIAYLVEKMDACGVEGSIEDEEKIAPDIDIHGEGSVKAFERMKDVIYGDE